jgi:hypothetical protein
MEHAHGRPNLAALFTAPKRLEEPPTFPYKPPLAERPGGWVAQMVRAVDS